MTISYFRVLLYGNLMLALMHSLLSHYVGFNIYVSGALIVSLGLLVGLRNTPSLPRFYKLFIWITAFGVLYFIYREGVGIGSKVAVRYLLFATTLVLVYVLINQDIKQRYVEMVGFVKMIGLLLVLDLIVTLVIKKDALLSQEGVNSTLFDPVFFKYLSIMVLPFMFHARKMYTFVGVILFVLMLLGTRAGMLAGLFVILMSVVTSEGFKIVSSRIVRGTILFIVVVSVVLSSFTLIDNTRQQELGNSSSTLARIAIWINYLSVLKDYPLGTGPQGAFHKLKKEGFSGSFANSLLLYQMQSRRVAESLRDRFNILEKKDKAISEESFHVSFIVSYGIVGILVWLGIVRIMVFDLLKVLRTDVLEAVVAYTSFGAVLIYGLFNSFHSGIVFIVIVSMLYFRLRPFLDFSRKSSSPGYRIES